jgi:signal transduction histidine kinase
MQDSEQAQLSQLASHLHSQRELLLTEWRSALRQDPELTAPSRLPRAALDDHIPDVLENFERRLRAEHSLQATEIELEQRKKAVLHALNRWERGYEMREMVREWGHLQLVVQRELDRYVVQHPQTSTEAIASAREALTVLCMEGMSESAAKYLRLLQSEAKDRYDELAASLKTLRELEDERAVVLRHAAHDLRGSVGVVSNASALLAKPDLGEDDRIRFYGTLQRGIGAMGTLLADLMDLARLEAGDDPPAFERFDAAARIKESCELLRPLAIERNLFLKCEGVVPLWVEGDPLKLHRIVQNLVLNAMKATAEGGIVVRWEATAPTAWALSIQDSGSGFDPERLVATAPRAAPSGAQSGALGVSEGIGLSIVKRLCNLLGASVHIDSGAEHGTTIRVQFPTRYAGQ